ncbi:MAG: TolC family protein [Desulfuromonadaceae bacterium]|nr:TolC family protein [Desulfuromonadaceae bacterium]
MTFSHPPRIILIVFLLLSNTVAASSATETRMTLADCIATAVRENRTIKNAYLDRIVQKYDLRVAEDKFTPKLLLTPSIQASGGSDPTPTTAVTGLSGTVTEQFPTGAAITLGAKHDITSTENVRTGRSYGWNVSLTQPFLKGAGFEVNTASVISARRNEQSNILSLKSTLMDTLTSVVTAYRSYIQAIKSLEINRQSLIRSRELIEINKELIAAGRMAAIESVQSEADVAGKEFSLLSSENAVDAARLALTKAIDIDKNSRIIPVEETGIPPVPYTLEEGKKLAFENRPDYLSSLLGYENAKLDLVIARNSTLWDLSLTGGYGNSYTRDGVPGSDSSAGAWNAGLTLSVPLGDLSIRQGLLASEIAMKKLEHDMARQREDIEIEVQDALRSAEMNLRQIRLATLSRSLTEQKVEIETDKLKAGRSTNFQLVSFQNDLVNARNSELDAIITYLNALTALDRTLGITLDRWGVSLAERK